MNNIIIISCKKNNIHNIIDKYFWIIFILLTNFSIKFGYIHIEKVLQDILRLTEFLYTHGFEEKKNYEYQDCIPYLKSCKIV